jgi:hypothetical protein
MSNWIEYDRQRCAYQPIRSLLSALSSPFDYRCTVVITVLFQAITVILPPSTNSGSLTVSRMTCMFTLTSAHTHSGIYEKTPALNSDGEAVCKLVRKHIRVPP